MPKRELSLYSRQKISVTKLSAIMVPAKKSIKAQNKNKTLNGEKKPEKQLKKKIISIYNTCTKNKNLFSTQLKTPSFPLQLFQPTFPFQLKKN